MGSPSGILGCDAALDDASISAYACVFGACFFDPDRSESLSPVGPELEDAVQRMLEERFEIPILVVQASKTRITRLMSMPVFQEMTVRNWRTTTLLSEMLDGG